MIRPQLILALGDKELIIDNFAGGGGANVPELAVWFKGEQKGKRKFQTA